MFILLVTRTAGERERERERVSPGTKMRNIAGQEEHREGGIVHS